MPATKLESLMPFARVASPVFGPIVTALSPMTGRSSGPPPGDVVCGPHANAAARPAAAMQRLARTPMGISEECQRARADETRAHSLYAVGERSLTRFRDDLPYFFAGG